jgi:wyosine [tRNA(Phe)-imidazoG37] synthetase (radical SAM superfamily)
MRKQYVFGPVASRRLGVSLGVDVIKASCCSLDCIYCEAKATTCLTLERKEYVPVDAVTAELDEVLRAAPALDYITFSGAGEPTLNSRIGDVISFLKEHYPQYPVCLLTNGCSFCDPALLKEIAAVDRIIPSLDASCQAEFQQINRPAPELDFDTFAKNLIRFTRQSKAEIYLELFIVPGVNDSDGSIERFVRLIRQMRLNGVQLNTLDRPGIADWLTPSTPENTRRFIAALEPFVPIEAIGKFRYRSTHPAWSDSAACEAEKQLLAAMRQASGTIQELVQRTGIPEERVRVLADSLCKFELADREDSPEELRYSARPE